MVVRIHNRDKWAVIEPGKALALIGDDERPVRIEVNCAGAARFDLVDLAGDYTFLTVVPAGGMQVIEFVARKGDVLVPSSDEEVWYFTNDGERVSTESTEVSFASVMTRKARNPQLELMMFKMEQNFERRLKLQAAEVAAIKAANPGLNTETGEIEDEPATSDDPPAAGGAGGTVQGEADEPAPAQAAGA
jgi:hypothetical protein